MIAHAKLSPSSAHRWMRCPGSASFGAQFPNTSNQASEDGTLAHERAAEELTALLRNEEIPFTPVPPDWLPPINRYVQYCSEIAARSVWFGIEQRVTIGHLTDERDENGGLATGTADFLAISEDGTLHVADLKFGQGDLVMSETAEDDLTRFNPQTALYALGALHDLDFLGGVEKVRLHIVQPRRDNINSVEVTLDDLHEFAEKVRAAARATRENGDQFRPSPTACRWCPGRAHCSVRANVVRVFAAQELNFLRADELPPLLAQVENIRQWCDDIEKRALRELMHGVELPGYKLVEGRSTRKWTPDAEHALPAILGSNAWRIEKKLITIGEAEKLLGKKHELFAKVTSKAPGAPQVAPATDPRPPLRLDAASEFSPTSE